MRGSRIRRQSAAVMLAGVVTVVLAVGACGSEESSSGSGSANSGAKKNVKIGVMLFSTSLPFYAPLQKGLKAEAAKLGAEVDIQNGQLDPAREGQLIQQFATQGKDAIIVSASNVDAVVPSVKVANQRDIPVMGLTNDIGKGAERLTYVGTDNVEFGRLLGKGALEAGGPNAKVALILGALGTSSQRDRTKGFNEFIAKNPGIKLLASQTGNWDNAQALKVGQDFLNKYGEGEIDVIVDEGPEGAAPAKYAAQNGREDVKFVVGDISTDVQAQLKSGTVAQAVFQDPYQQARTAVQYAVAAAGGQEAKVPSPFAYQPMRLFGSDDWSKVPDNALF